MQQFKQFASGNVLLQIVPGSTHCGVDDRQLSLDYEIELGFLVADSALDENGFLLDNTAFRGYFTALSTVPINISCEKLAMKVAKDIAEMVGRDRSLSYVRVKMSPFAGVAVEHVLAVPASMAVGSGSGCS